MLIIAIPKSASTSLMTTLSRLHGLPREQDTTLRENMISKETKVLHKFHSDVRELKEFDVAKLANAQKIFKQHIFPSQNNIRLLKKVKKVVLLRDPEEVVLAYKRGMQKKVHNQLKGLDVDLTDEEFLKESETIGLLGDLKNFYLGWKNHNYESGKHLKIVYYRNLINNPKEVINEIELFFELKVHEDQITLAKERYSRRNKVVNFLRLIEMKLRKFIHRLKE